MIHRNRRTQDESRVEPRGQRFLLHESAITICGLLISISFCGTVSAESKGPAIPGNHPLSQAQEGDVLIDELRCAACHTDVRQGSLPERIAPELAEAGSRISPEYLRQFLVAPFAAQPGTTMPDVLASKPEAERDRIAEALTHFLLAQSKVPFQSNLTPSKNQQEGKSLYHSVGCVACHGPREPPPDMPPTIRRDDEDEADPETPAVAVKTFPAIAVKLGHVAGKYSTKSLSEFLFQPLHVRKSGRMPDMKLTRAEAQALAAYLMGDPPHRLATLVPKEPLVTAGKQYFQELNCAACHGLSGIPPAPLGGSLKKADLSRGCLSKTTGRGPRYQLEEPQVEAIRAALRENSEPNPDKPDSDKVVVAKTLTAFRCIACHIRDDYGGVPEEYSPFFAGSEKNMGEDGRIPPPLTLVGAKLQPAWLKKVLFDGESVRHYMATRMPQYGSANLQHLPALFTRLDVLEGKEMNIPSPESDSESERQRERLLRKAGQELLGDKGVACITCHNFNGKPAPVNKGIDLMTTYQRLQPAWFNSFVRNPGAFRPRIIMPMAWANGVAAHKTILDGNTDMQIEAIWYYLSLGTSAADPPGIRWVNTQLSVGDLAKVHRGRSRVAGYRGIAVGLPEKLSYAFNAETGTLSALWQGPFIGVDWNGQGSGGFNPASEPVQLAQDVSFVQLSDEKSPWPVMPVMTKDARVNPNPLYPKNLGYQFRGYFLGESSIPTFQYRSGTIEIEDRTVAAGSSEKRHLRRVLQFDSPERQTVWFRALTGEIQKESDRVFRSGRLRLTIPNVETNLRPMGNDPKQSELLLRLPVPQGKSTVEVEYELIQK